MVKDFSTKAFLRNVSPKLLQQFFKKQQVLADFDWTLEEEAFIEGLNQAIEGLPKEPRGYIEETFETIHEFSDEEGILCLLDIIRTLHPAKAEEIIEKLMKQKGPHEQVLWLVMHDPAAVEWAMRLERVQGMKFKHECLVGKGLDVSTEQEIIDAFQELLQKFYKKQKRGGNCQVEAYVREEPTRYCFFVFPEDHAKRDLQYKKGKLTTALRWPVMEHVFIYEPTSGKLRISAGRIKNVKPMQEAFCKAFFDLPGLPDGSTMVYDLSPLMKPEFTFTDKPVHQIESISLRMLKAAVLNDRTHHRRLTCEGQPKDGGAEYLRTMMNKAALAIGVTMDKIKIISAKITIVFKATAERRKTSVTFILTNPGGSTLEDKPLHHIANQYLEDWGLAKLLLAKEDEAA